MTVCQSGARMQRMVGAEPSTRGDRQVVDDSAETQQIADLIRLRLAGLIDEAQPGNDHRIEEAQGPRQIAIAAGERNLLARSGLGADRTCR